MFGEKKHFQHTSNTSRKEGTCPFPDFASNTYKLLKKRGKIVARNRHVLPIIEHFNVCDMTVLTNGDIPFSICPYTTLVSPSFYFFYTLLSNVMETSLQKENVIATYF
jgi:hypothetical protein